MASRNVSCTISQAEMLCKEKVSSMGPEDWVRKCRHVETIEDEYLAQEPAIDNIVESLIISTNSDSESDSESSDDADEGLSGVEELE